MHGAALGHAGKAGANLHALHGVQAHHGVGDVGVELVEQGLAQPHRHARGLHADACAARVAGLAQRIHVVLVLRDIGHWRKKRIVAHMLPALERDGQLAELRHAGAKLGAVLLGQPLLGHGTRGHRGRCQAR